MTTKLQQHRNERKDDQEQQSHEIDKDLNRFGLKLIKVIGVFGVALGVIILCLFWYWIFRKIL